MQETDLEGSALVQEKDLDGTGNAEKTVLNQESRGRETPT